MRMEPAEWTPRRKALYAAAQGMGAQMRGDRRSWNFLLPDSDFPALRLGTEAVERTSPIGTYIKRKEWVILRDHGYRAGREGGTFSVDRLTFGDEAAFYIAGDGRIFTEVKEVRDNPLTE
jgi:hypothetical protein